MVVTAVLYFGLLNFSEAHSCTVNTGTVAGVGGSTNAYAGDGGKATSAKLGSPLGMFLSNSDEIWVAELDNKRHRKISTNKGDINLAAGSGKDSRFKSNGDGLPATHTSVMLLPYFVCGNAFGEVFVTENDHSVVRMVGSDGIISTYAGTGKSGEEGDGGQATAADLYKPSGCTVDASGDLYVADSHGMNYRKVSLCSFICLFVYLLW